MNTLTFELAPRSRLHDWDKALAFAIAPSAPTFAAVYFMADSAGLAGIVTAVAFFGILICAFTLATTRLGRITLTPQELRLDSGFLSAAIPLADLDLASARLGATEGADHRLLTNPAYAVTLPRRTGAPLVVTPIEREGLLRALHAFAARS